MKTKTITRDLLIECLHYDPETGAFTWRNRPSTSFATESACKSWNLKYAGKKAGSIAKQRGGYLAHSITICRVKFRAHRLAWLYMTGEYPEFEIDHENRDATDNRWGNLRKGEEVNKRNLSKSSRNRSGVTGVSWDTAKGKWRAVGCYTDDNGRYRTKHLGYFDEINEAEASSVGFRKNNGYSPSHGQPRPVAKGVCVMQTYL